MGLRHKSIRLRVILLVLIPLVSLIGVYTYATSTTVRTAVDLVRAGTVAQVTVKPTSNLVKQIDAERSLAVAYLVNPASSRLTQLNQQEARTDAALKRFEGVSMSGPLAANASALEKAMVATLITATRGVPGLPGLRANVAANGITRQDAISQYSALAMDGYRVIDQAIQKTNISQTIVTTALQQTSIYEAGQLLLQENDLYAGDAEAGSFPPADRIEFAQLSALRRSLMAEALPQLDATSHALYRRDVTPATSDAIATLENKIIYTPGRHGAPVPLSAWRPAFAAYVAGLSKMLTAGTVAIVAQVKSSAQTTLIGLILAGGLGLLAIIASVLFSILIGRGLLRQLRELRESALELAHERLPDIMQRLRDGKTVDVAIEAPPVESSADEIDQVRQAFNVVQRTAIETAVDEARLRQGVSEVFRNLARRSQVLLHRQLRLLDGMERRASQPEELEDLFRIDHLTTRMRRHAEGLIILSGESPGRSWRHPVPLVDIMRAAVAEVEDYTRISVESGSRAALAGSAVADVIHLIAELAENATVFSPPNTPVRIYGDIVGRGFAVEVEDRGLGIAPERLAEINRNLASPPVFDLSGSDRLGLFIAGQLARRHDIKITLRPSPYGGATAIVIIPLSLIVDEDAIERVSAIVPNGRGQLSARPAALAGGRAGTALDSAGTALDSAGTALESAGTALESAGTALDAGGRALDAGGRAPDSGDGPDSPSPGSSPASGARSPVAALPTAPLPEAGLPAGPVAASPSACDPAGIAPLPPLPAGDEPGWPGQGPPSVPAMDRPEPTTLADLDSRTTTAGLGKLTFSGDPGGVGDWGDPGGTGARGDLGGATNRGDLGGMSDRGYPGGLVGQDNSGGLGDSGGSDGRGDMSRGAPGGGDLDDTGDLGVWGLPVRVRQASLAPELRDTPRPDNGPSSGEPGPASAEAARTTMAAVQRGWERGRSGLADPPPGDGARDGSGQ